jgi:hypothetical protein
MDTHLLFVVKKSIKICKKYAKTAINNKKSDSCGQMIIKKGR